MSSPSRFLEAPNAYLIGVRGGRSRLLTPSLIVDLDVFEANLAKMQARCNAAGIALRPHGKAHKCPEIARQQIAAGAQGVCVATPGEAEIFAKAGLDDILVTSTFGSLAACERLVRVAASGARLTLLLDSAEMVRTLAEEARNAGIVIPVLIDVDMGRHRSGVSTPELAADLAAVISQEESLMLCGVQAYAGHLSHCASPSERAAGAAAVNELVRGVLAAIEPFVKTDRPVVTGCSTGALGEELALDLYTEAQCGSYIFMDVEYDAIDPDGSGVPSFDPSLAVVVSVISANHPGIATTDGGEKRFAAKKAVTVPKVLAGAPEGSLYKPTSDEHGTLTLPAGATVHLGDLIELQAPHCDPTVNLYDFIHAVRGDVVEAIWPVEARGM